MASHAGVIGAPIRHSLSPVLHQAAYRALGLTGWSFHREEVGPGELAAYLARLGEDWVGLAVTMPLKEEALAAAQRVGADADLVGGANTLLRADGGWRAENTDVPGLVTALQQAGLSAAAASPAAVLGSGATARSALVALHRCGIRQVQLIVRDRLRPGAAELAEQLGMTLTSSRYADGPAGWGRPGVVVSTVPAGATPPVAGWELAPGAVLLDVGYAPWPTSWATQWQAQGQTVCSGATMLLHQAGHQVALMTGRSAPLSAMATALQTALGRPVGERR